MLVRIRRQERKNVISIGAHFEVHHMIHSDGDRVLVGLAVGFPSNDRVVEEQLEELCVLFGQGQSVLRCGIHLEYLDGVMVKGKTLQQSVCDGLKRLVLGLRRWIPGQQ